MVQPAGIPRDSSSEATAGVAPRPGVDGLAERLIDQARAAHHAATTGAGLDAYSYPAGERNAYAYAAALILTHGTGTFAVADRIIDDLSDGITDLHQLLQRARSLPQTAQVSAADVPPRDWIGPVAFTTRYAGHGVDEDFGTTWGPRRDQRVSHRHQLGADEGLLYVYDPTWHEYAVLATQASLRCVREAFTDAMRTDGDLPVTAFAALVTAQSPAGPRQESPAVQL